MMEKKLEEGESHDANEESGEKKEEIIIAFSYLVLKIEKHPRHCTDFAATYVTQYSSVNEKNIKKIR